MFGLGGIISKLNEHGCVKYNAVVLSFLVVTFASWGLYPFRGVVWLNPPFTYVVLVLLGIFFASAIFYYRSWKRLNFPRPLKWAGYFYLVYLAALGVATLSYGELFSIEQYVKLSIKILFFLFIVIAVDRTTIEKSFDLYSNLILCICIFSLLVMFAVAVFFVQPFWAFPTVSAGGTVVELPFYGVFYGQAPWPIGGGFPIARLQGLSGEPGTFALALFPAYFYFLFVGKTLWKICVVLISLVLTVSFGAALFLVAVTVFMFLFRAFRRRHHIVNLVTMLLVGLCFVLPTQTSVHDYNKNWNGWGNWVAYLEGSQEATLETNLSTLYLEGKKYSFDGRLASVGFALDFLSDHPLGAGAGAGMVRLHEAVPVGYVVALLEAGIVGGSFYFVAFCILGLTAVFSVGRPQRLTEHHADITHVLALSVLALLYFALQRMQADLSFWQMWIYAGFIKVCCASETDGHDVSIPLQRV